MEMLIKETRNESFLRNHRNSLTKQLLNPSTVSSVTAADANVNTNSTFLPLSRKKFVKNTNFDKAEFEKLISNTTNHNKITSLMNSQTSISIAKAETITSDTLTKLDLHELEIEDKDEDDDFLKKVTSSSISGKKSSKNTKTKSNNKTLQQQKSIDITSNTNNSNNISTQTKKSVKKDKKSKKKSKTSANDNRTYIEHHHEHAVNSFSHPKTTTSTNDLLSASKSSLFPKVAPQRDTTAYKSFKSKSNKPKEEYAPPPAPPPPPPLPSLVQPLTNESLRWDKRMDDPDEEAKRIELYKLNRRKRYIEQRNKYLNLNSSTARSSNLFSMYENDDYDSESTQNNLNNEETSSIYESKEATSNNNNTNTTTANLLASTSTTRLLSSDIYNKMKLKERSNITDSAISSMSSNSR